MSFFRIEPKIYGAWELEDRVNLFDQIVEPIRRRLNYQNVIRNIVRVDSLLQDDELFVPELEITSNPIARIVEIEERRFNVVRNVLGDIIDVDITVRSKLMNTILESADDVLEYEDEIVGIHKAGRYSRYGRNGCLMAIREFCDDNNMIISDNLDLNEVVDSIFWV